MRIVIPVVVDMTDDQVAAYCDEYGVGNLSNGRWVFRAKDVVGSVRSYVLTCIQDSPAFSEHADGTADGPRGADVSIKER